MAKKKKASKAASKALARYSCAKCGEAFDSLPENVIRCPVCAHKVLLKVRQPVAKTVNAR